jgi:hypothetical protein
VANHTPEVAISLLEESHRINPELQETAEEQGKKICKYIQIIFVISRNEEMKMWKSHIIIKGVVSTEY